MKVCIYGTKKREREREREEREKSEKKRRCWAMTLSDNKTIDIITKKR